jgi:hypothetical protein
MRMKLAALLVAAIAAALLVSPALAGGKVQSGERSGSTIIAMRS